VVYRSVFKGQEGRTTGAEDFQRRNTANPQRDPLRGVGRNMSHRASQAEEGGETRAGARDAIGSREVALHPDLIFCLFWKVRAINLVKFR
jgi:hypothetical protein